MIKFKYKTKFDVDAGWCFALLLVCCLLIIFSVMICDAAGRIQMFEYSEIYNKNTFEVKKAPKHERRYFKDKESLNLYIAHKFGRDWAVKKTNCELYPYDKNKH